MARGDDSILDLRSVHKSVSLMSDVPPHREDDVGGSAMVILPRGQAPKEMMGDDGR